MTLYLNVLNCASWKQWKMSYEAKSTELAACEKQAEKAKGNVPPAEMNRLKIQVRRNKKTVDTMCGFKMGDKDIADEYLQQTLLWYGRCLQLKSGQQRDMAIVFRICALWFKNAKNDATNR